MTKDLSFVAVFVRDFAPTPYPSASERVIATQLDNDAAEVLRQWKNGKDEWHGWKCALTTLANQLDSEWTAEDCRDHILSIANQLGYGDYDDD